MPFILRDLIVTLNPGVAEEPSGGGTVGSCTSECGVGRPDLEGCGQSDEVLDPLKGFVDSKVLVEMRLMLRLAYAQGRTRTPKEIKRTAALVAKMTPHTAKEADKLETGLKGALSELRKVRKGLQR